MVLKPLLRNRCWISAEYPLIGFAKWEAIVYRVARKIGTLIRYDLTVAVDERSQEVVITRWLVMGPDSGRILLDLLAKARDEFVQGDIDVAGFLLAAP